MACGAAAQTVICPDSDGALERIWSEWKSGKYLIEHQGLCDLTRTW